MAFGKRTRAKDGLFSECKVCRSERAKQKYIKNKIHINKLNAKWKVENAEKHKEINARWRENNKERNQETGKVLYAKNRGQIRIRHKEWYKNNKEKKKKQNEQWKAANPELARLYRIKAGNKQRSTPQGKLNDSMSSAIWHSLKGLKAGRRWESLAGYTVHDLKQHLEKQFTPGMEWDNYGLWEIDHKTPKTAWNFEKPEDIDFKACWSLKNLSPLWKSVNRRKYNKLEKPFQPSLALQGVANG